MAKLTPALAITVTTLAALMLSACGDNATTAPTQTATTTTIAPAQANRAPVITSVTVTPPFGIADLQTFAFQAAASDADGDPLTYSWAIAANSAAGPTTSLAFASPGGTYAAVVTVTDGKGGTATASVPFTVGSMSGAWHFDSDIWLGGTARLAQGSTGTITGTVSVPRIGTGPIDPAVPGTIRSDGGVTMRVKVGTGPDVTLTGTMDATGNRVAGTIDGVGFSGLQFSMVK